MQWIVLKPILIKWNQAHFLVIVKITLTAVWVNPQQEMSHQTKHLSHTANRGASNI